MRMSLRDAVAMSAAVLAPFLMGLALVPLRTSLSHTNLALLLVVVVVAVSALGNRFAGALAAMSAVAWFDFFHTEPHQSFHIQDRADVETAVLLLFVGLAVSQLSARARVLRRAAVSDARHLERLHALARLLRSGRGSADELVEQIREELIEVLDLRGCRFVHGSAPVDRPLPRLEPDGSLRVDGWIWDLDRQGWPDGETELWAVAHGRCQGVFVMTPVPGVVPASPEARLVAVDLAGLAALVLSGQKDLAQP
ncbi:DUF4118 domain-containing protein [Streptomyces sp. NPDC090025]|uniref:DUF4118 domain-containing protein n=1 Tax=Streptomyces sp. NPDC090025 TaxID=3365922 RepID=UPI0038341346